MPDSALVVPALLLAVIVVLAVQLRYMQADARLQRKRADERISWWEQKRDARRTAEVRLAQLSATNHDLQVAVQKREQAIAGLLNRLNAVAVANVSARRVVKLGLPVHRVDPQQFSPN